MNIALPYGLRLCLLLIMLAALVSCGPEDNIGREINTPAPRASGENASGQQSILSEPNDQAVVPEGDVFPDAKLLNAKIRIGLLLPLSGEEAAVGLALLQSVTLAYFDAYDPRLELIPMDTKATLEGLDRLKPLLTRDPFDLIIGPLSRELLPEVAGIAQERQIPLLSLSNDTAQADQNRYIFGIPVESEIRHIMAHAAARGDGDVAAMLPLGPYGDQMLSGLGVALAESDMTLAALQRYPRIAENLFEPVEKITDYKRRKKELDDEIDYLRSLRDDLTDEIARDLATREEIPQINYGAVLVGEGGALLRTLAPLFPFYEVDREDVHFYGTGLMFDPDLGEEPNLRQYRFAGPSLDAALSFFNRYEALYGAKPPPVSLIGYDAMALAASLTRNHDFNHTNDEDDFGEISGPFNQMAFTNAEGFKGITGLFRFNKEGRITRSLAILEITADGLKEVEPPLEAFPDFGSPLKGVFPPEDD